MTTGFQAPQMAHGCLAGRGRWVCAEGPGCLSLLFSHPASPQKQLHPAPDPCDPGQGTGRPASVGGYSQLGLPPAPLLAVRSGLAGLLSARASPDAGSAELSQPSRLSSPPLWGPFPRCCLFREEALDALHSLIHSFTYSSFQHVVLSP